MPAMSSALSAAATAERIAALADQCVMCGLCLPQCPTYRVSGTEAESPRGRIAFARALAGDAADVDESMRSHLDQCLACRSCESICPSNVGYGELLVATRTLIEQRRPARRGLLDRLTARPAWLRAAVRAGRMLGVERWLPPLARRVLRPASSLARIAAEFPALPAPITIPAWTAARGIERGRIAVFAGCVASAFDRDTLAGAVRLLSAAGYGVALPPQQGCCGALARYAGRIDQARQLAEPTQRALLRTGTDTVLVTSSGCFDTLRDITLAGTPLRVREIGDFLAHDEGMATLRFHPFARRAALHMPCTLANMTRSGDAMATLLQRVPELTVLSLPVQPRCCGAAGDYFLRHAAIADALRSEMLASVAALAPDLLLTSNIGCRLFLANGLRRSRAIDVLHPVTLLARQLET